MQKYGESMALVVKSSIFKYIHMEWSLVALKHPLGFYFMNQP